jgi:hypothetical protein
VQAVQRNRQQVASKKRKQEHNSSEKHLESHTHQCTVEQTEMQYQFYRKKHVLVSNYEDLFQNGVT